MNLEQSSNEDRYEKKKKKSREKLQLDFFESKKLVSETTHLLQKLAKDISVKYGIDISDVKNLIENKTASKLEDLLLSVNSSKNINLDDLLWEINAAKIQIEDLSKKYREQLKNNISRFSLETEKHNYISSKKIFSDTFLARIQEPQNISDNIFWAWVGIIDSSEAVIFFLYNLWKWVLLTPYHVYLLLRWEGKIKL